MNDSFLVAVKPLNQGSIVYLSKFDHDSFSMKCITPGVAIKYVLSGVENYYHNNSSVSVKAGQYLVLNNEKNFEVCIDFARTPVRGLCINISEQIINDVLYNFEKDEVFLLDNPSCPANKKFDLFESIFKQDDILSMHLKNLTRYINEEERTLNISDSEFYYGIANKLMLSQNIVSKEISGIKPQRYEVKKELYKRLLKAKEIMDDPGENFKISGIAAMVALSEFHFYRTFKQAFGITPHQYQIKNKLHKAASLLEEGRTAIEDVAFDCGFTDIFSFSKTFKKHFNVTPSFYKKFPDNLSLKNFNCDRL